MFPPALLLEEARLGNFSRGVWYLITLFGDIKKLLDSTIYIKRPERYTVISSCSFWGDTVRGRAPLELEAREKKIPHMFT